MLAEHKGTGAAGGMGYALKLILNAKLVSGANLVFKELNFERHVK